MFRVDKKGWIMNKVMNRLSTPLKQNENKIKTFSNKNRKFMVDRIENVSNKSSAQYPKECRIFNEST